MLAILPGITETDLLIYSNRRQVVEHGGA